MTTLTRRPSARVLATLDEPAAIVIPFLFGGPSRAGRPGDEPSPGRQPAATGERGPILVVEDNQALLDAVCEALQDDSYPVVSAGDGATALQMIADHHPSLILLDMRLPVMNGWDVARELKARGITVPIIIMTAAQDAAAWAAEVGATGYLAKPFELDALLDMVEQVRPRTDD